MNGMTRLANILTILVFVADFTKCEISDIKTMVEHSFLYMIDIMRLTTSIFAVIVTGIKIFGCIILKHIFGTILPYMISGFSIYGLMLIIMTVSEVAIAMFTIHVITDILLLGANFLRSAENRPAQTPLKVFRETPHGYKNSYTSPREIGVRVGFYGQRIMFGGNGGIRPNLQAGMEFASNFSLIERFLSLAWLGINIISFIVEIVLVTFCATAHLFTQG